MVFGMEFLLVHHIIIVLVTTCLMIMGGDPCMLLVQNKQPQEIRLVSNLQFKKGVK